MTLHAESKIFKHGKAATLYCLIPSKMAKDSAFTIKAGDIVQLRWFPSKNWLEIKRK